MTEQALVEKVAEAMAGPLGARVPFDMLPEDASQPRLADGSRLTQEVLLDAARAVLSAIREAGCAVVPSDIRRSFFYPIEMPLSEDGQGPAKVGVDATQITYEVWDQLLNSHGSHENLPDAINQAIALNSCAASQIGGFAQSG
jgi:hypothetical protein